MNELKAKLEKKETQLQTREKKWMAIEKIVENYAKNDQELRIRLEDSKVVLRPD